MEIAISIGENLLLGLVLFGLLRWRLGADPVHATSSAEALQIFRRFFPDAGGRATLAQDGRGALIELDGGGCALLLRRGRRWNARLLIAGEISRVTFDEQGAMQIAFADFGWPRARIALADGNERATWRARLAAIASRHALPEPGRA